ncbi:MAG: fibronectin/fibrinogen-binding protein [Campylobacterales bacterium]|nr:fibronectin/fibrinogen-binding protein [Campylobacterales bacterium]
MKLFVLKKIIELLSQFEQIKNIYRVDDNLIKIEFSKSEIFFFDMTKQNSYIFKKDEFLTKKFYNAPFDNILKKRVQNAKIEKVFLLNGDKVIRFELNSSSSYKSLKTFLQFEFTGKYTNVIILDEFEVVLEALRHIDIEKSFREVKVGIKLEDIPKREFVEDIEEIDDINQYLYKIYEEKSVVTLNRLKTQALININKKIKNYDNILNNLEFEDDLLNSSKDLEFKANLLLININKLKNYQTTALLEDYENNLVEIEIPTAKSVHEAINKMFLQSKKLKKRASSIHIERENLTQKIDFFKKNLSLIENSTSIDELSLYIPETKKIRKQQKNRDSFETFIYKDYSILVGRNKQENIRLLENAKASDIWLHLKDRTSSHVIIKTDKQNVPQDVIEFGAKLCVEFSVSQKGSFLVDYTHRRFVKIQSEANVFYQNYKTIPILRE